VCPGKLSRLLLVCFRRQGLDNNGLKRLRNGWRVDYPLYYTCRYHNRLTALPTIRSTLYGDVLQLTICCALLCVASLQLSITDYPTCSTLSVDSTTDYPIYRLSALICLPILQPTILCALLCLLILQPTIQSADFALCSVYRYYNRLSYVLYSVC
jgi:hypothetical protein